MDYKATVLQVGPLPPPIGGISIFLNDLRKAELKEVNLEFFNIFPKKDKKLNKMFYNFVVYFKYVYILLKVKPDIIHIHTAAYRSFWKNSGIVFLSKIFKKKIIMHMHSGHFDEFYSKVSDKKKSFIRKVLGICDNVICLSDGWKEYYRSKLELEENKMKVVRNGIYVEDFFSSRLQRIKDDDDELNILFIGSLTEKKGIKDLVEISKKLKKINRSRYKFTVIGNGPLYSYLENAIIDHELNIELCGELTGEQKNEKFRKADVLFLPSYAEGMPISIIEGMAAGMVIVATNVGAIPEIIIENKNGFLFNPGDKDAAVNCFLELRKEQLDKIGQTNRKIAVAEFDFKNVLKKLEQIYLSFIPIK